MNKLTLPVLLSFSALGAGAADMTGSLEYVANPASTFYKNDLADRITAARSCREIFLYRNRLYVGMGDSSKNTGETPIFSVDPYSGQVTKEWLSGSEEISEFKVSEICFSGSGEVASIYGEFVDASVARADGVRCDTLADTTASGRPVTHITNRLLLLLTSRRPHVYNERMNLSEILIILGDQKEILQALLAERTCSRKEEGLIRLESKLAQVVTGVRRSGKSAMCLNVLKASGRPFGYVNFDDERLTALTGSDLDDVLAAACSLTTDGSMPSRTVPWPCTGIRARVR